MRSNPTCFNSSRRVSHDFLCKSFKLSPDNSLQSSMQAFCAARTAEYRSLCAEVNVPEAGYVLANGNGFPVDFNEYENNETGTHLCLMHNH